MEQKIKNIMASVFGCNTSEIDDSTSADTLENWDSLRHMNLIVALEEEFNLNFSEDETMEMLNYKLICIVISDKLSVKNKIGE